MRPPRTRFRHSSRPALTLGFLGLFLLGAGGVTGPQDLGPGARIHPALARCAAAAPDDSLSVWVWLCDKGLTGPESARALAELRLEISDRALERRRRRGRITGLVPADLPVSPAYLHELRSAGLRLRRTSRWLNAASGVVAPADLTGLAARACVVRVSPLGRSVSRPPDGAGDRSRSESAGAPGTDRNTTASGPVAPRSGPDGGGAGARQYDADFYGYSWEQCSSLQVPRLHEQGLSGEGVIVGVLDSGFRFGHEAMRDSMVVAAYDFVNDDAEVQNEPGDPFNAWNHGTKVWGIIAAYLPGTLVGPAYNARFLLAKTEDEASETVVEEDNWVAAIEWMEAQGVDVTNTSLGYYDWYGYRDTDGDTAPITIAADAAAARGVVVVTSAGNEGNYPGPPSDPDATPITWYIGPPADGDSVIAAGATYGSGVRVSFSSHGPTFDGRIKPDLMARGVDVATVSPSNLAGYELLGDGTSYSSPLIAGVAALLLEAHPDWDPMHLLEALQATADRSHNLEPGVPDNDYGWGYVQGAAASAWGEIPTPPPGELGFFAYPNPFSDRTTFNCALPAAGSGSIIIFTRTGTRVRTLAVRATRPGVVEYVWDGRNDTGAAVVSGVYHAVLSFEGLRARTTVLKIR